MQCGGSASRKPLEPVPKPRFSGSGNRRRGARGKGRRVPAPPRIDISRRSRSRKAIVQPLLYLARLQPAVHDSCEQEWCDPHGGHLPEVTPRGHRKIAVTRFSRRHASATRMVRENPGPDECVPRRAPPWPNTGRHAAAWTHPSVPGFSPLYGKPRSRCVRNCGQQAGLRTSARRLCGLGY